MPMIRLDETANGTQISIGVATTLVIDLAENPTTGYEWQLVASDEQVTPLDRVEFAGGTSTGIGSGGSRLFQFRGVAPGYSEIKIALTQSFEDDVLTLFVVTAHVVDEVR